jgi:hypothetical protein
MPIMTISIALRLESLMKRQCEIGCVKIKWLKFQKDMVPVGNPAQAHRFFYPVLIAASVGKGVGQRAATRVDINMLVVI